MIMFDYTAIPNDWLYPPNLKVAAQLQAQLAARVELVDAFEPLKIIAGVDVSNNPRDPQQLIYAVVLTLDALNLSHLEQAATVEVQRFPYVPGFLGFREAPALVTAFSQLKVPPDLIFVDGHGISHPRGLGIASHLGVLLDKPTIGVAKSILVGQALGELADEPGAEVPLVWKGKQLGTVLRTKRRCKPLIISPGHKVSMQTAVSLVKQYLRAYRLPEPTRHAHLLANHYRKIHMQP